jgi:hypothetical protein
MEDKSVAKIRAGVSRRKISRRKPLKGAGAAAGLAAGAGAITGFPTIWAQNIKDITLLQVGGSYSSIIDIARQAMKDPGSRSKCRISPATPWSTALPPSLNPLISPT